MLTNQQILEKAIQKAIDGGWQHAGMRVAIGDGVLGFNAADWNQFIADENHYQLIFNHDFAKSLFGDDHKVILGGHGASQGMTSVGEAWKHHLQMMVIAPDPIRYLGENL